MIKILTNKENDKIFPEEFEVLYNNKLIITGRVFEHSKQDGRGHSINFVFVESLPKNQYDEACNAIYDKFAKK